MEDGKSTNYEYPEIITRALNKVVVPTIRTLLMDALASCMTNEGIYNYVNGIMKEYKYYDKVILSSADPIGSITDFTALWFLLFPYIETNEMDNKGKKVLKSTMGAADEYLIPYLSLSDKQRSQFLLLRKLRNAAAHGDKREITDIKPECATESGALNLIEELMKPLNTDIGIELKPIREDLKRLQNKKTDSSDFTLEKINAEKQKRQNIYLNMLTQARKLYAHSRYHQYTFEPIGQVFEGRAPWADSTDFISELEWPSNDPAVADEIQLAQLNKI